MPNRTSVGNFPGWIKYIWIGRESTRGWGGRVKEVIICILWNYNFLQPCKGTLLDLLLRTSCVNTSLGGLIGYETVSGMTKWKLRTTSQTAQERIQLQFCLGASLSILIPVGFCPAYEWSGLISQLVVGFHTGTLRYSRGSTGSMRKKGKQRAFSKAYN